MGSDVLGRCQLAGNSCLTGAVAVAKWLAFAYGRRAAGLFCLSASAVGGPVRLGAPMSVVVAGVAGREVSD